MILLTRRFVLAQTCSFPFTLNSTNYTSCTTINDTRPWCSPTSLYNGQRLYCSMNSQTPNTSCQASLCSSNLSTTSPLKFVSMPCPVASVDSISPERVTAGERLVIRGQLINNDLPQVQTSFYLTNYRRTWIQF